METIANLMCIKKNIVTLSKYEVIEAFFRTEDEDDASMAAELNKLINVFYEQERKTRRNVTELPFDIGTNQIAINYIKKSVSG